MKLVLFVYLRTIKQFTYEISFQIVNSSIYVTFSDIITLFFNMFKI